MLPSSPLAVLACLLVTTAAQSWSIIPSNSTSYQPDNAFDGVLLGYTPVRHTYLMQVQPLTDYATWDLVNSTNAALVGRSGQLLNVDATNSNFTTEDMAYVSCDSGSYHGNLGLSDVITNLISNKVAAIILYSTSYNYCALNSTPADNAYPYLYSTTNTQNSTFLHSLINSVPNLANYPLNQDATILTGQQYTTLVNANRNGTASGGDGGSGGVPSPAVAMVILYSITGVITALFLCIIVTGAIRAHRHPELYGPRNVLGRPRQSRAKGLARAMLETLPIVKFGETQDDKQVELAETGNAKTSATEHTAEKKTATATTIARADSQAGESSSTAAAAAAAATATSVTSPFASSPNPADDDEGLVCSICTDEFEKGQDLRVLPCNHKFHPACVDPWLLDVSGTCPLCRVDLRPSPDLDPSSTDPATTDLPPPLDATAIPNPTPRRRGLRSLFSPRMLQSASREERLAVLRRFREESNRRVAAGGADDDVEGAGPVRGQGRAESARWRRMIRPSRHVRESLGDFS